MKSIATITVQIYCIIFAICVQCEGQSNQDLTDPLQPPVILTELPEPYKDENRLFQGIPSLQPTSNERLWLTWFSGGRGETCENIVLLATSGDRGETWSKPIMAIDPPGVVRAFDSSLWQDPRGRLWLFWSQGEETQNNPTIWDGRAGVWCMTCDHPELGEKAVWSEPRRLCDGIMNNQPIADSQGRYLLPVSVWRFDSKYFIPHADRGALVYASEDEGKTFSRLGRAEVPKEDSVFDEHNLIEKRDGSFWMTIRTRYGLGESFSIDGGRTWTVAAPSTVLKHTCSRFMIRRLQSGRLLLVKNGNYNEDVGRTKMMAFLSEDEGQTWLGGLLLDDRPEVSYPNGNQAEDGTIYVTWDYARYGGKEIMVARFTEEDILAGKAVSQNSKLKIVANKATGK